MIKQCVIIFGCLAVGELIIGLTGWSLPASIVGMILLTLCLALRLVKLEWVKGISDFLTRNLGLFFVPAGVAIMLFLDIIQANLFQIVMPALASTIITLGVTGWVHQIIRKKL